MSSSLPEELLSCPVLVDEEFTKRHVRPTCSEDGCIIDKDAFRVMSSNTEKRYGIQYSQMYFVRLETMRRRLVEAARREWG